MLSAVSKQEVLAAAEEPEPTPPPFGEDVVGDDEWVTPVPRGEDDWYEPEPDYEGIWESQQGDPEIGLMRAEDNYERYIGLMDY